MAKDMNNLLTMHNKNDLTTHKAESVTQAIFAQRNLTLTGVQTINVQSGRTPKHIMINSIVNNTSKQSVKLGNISTYQRGDGAVRLTATQAIVMADTSPNRTLGQITNIRAGAFDITWTHAATGTGATGTVDMDILVIYHD